MHLWNCVQRMQLEGEVVGVGRGGLSPKQSLHPGLYQNGVSILWGNNVFCKVRNLPRCSEGVTSVPIQEYTIGCCPENNVEVEMKALPPPVSV